jgi:type II secretory pathway pseudopilin PulG
MTLINSNRRSFGELCRSGKSPDGNYATSECRQVHAFHRDGFGRIELLAVLAALSLLLAIVLPALANDRDRSSRIVCANNLRQVGAALDLWGNERGDKPPWELTTANGGTQSHPLAGNAWFQFLWLTNELSSPKVLACPSDTRRPAAQNFGNSPELGYVHPSARNNATSYLLSHSYRESPDVLIAADRNLGFDYPNSNCNRFGTVPNVSAWSANFRWDTNLHQNSGHILRMDGSVEGFSNETLREAARTRPFSDGTDDQDMHVLFPN